MHLAKHAVIHGLSVAILVMGLVVPATAAEYPAKPITLVIPLSAGGVIDLAARCISNVARKPLGKPVIVENKTGGGGTVGVTLVVKKPADGYTLTMVATNNLNINWHVREMEFHPVEDLTPIMRVSGILSGIVVRADSRWKTIREFIQYSKENPGKVSYGSPGVGTPPHLAMEELASLAGGIRWVHIPYKGAADTNTALLGGHIDAAVGAPSWAPQVDAGTFRLLASIAPFRFARFPEVPTLKDIGYDMAYPSPIDLLGPRGLPKPVVQKLHDAFKAGLDEPECRDVLKRFEMFPTYLGPDDLEKATRREFEHMGRVVQKVGLQKKK